MPNQAPLVLKDGQAVPADRTFSPVNVNADGVAKYTDRTSGVLIGFPVITLQSKEATKQIRSEKVIGKVAIPILEQVSGPTGSGFQPAPTVAFTLYGNFDFTLPDRCTPAHRKDLVAITGNLISSALVKALTVDGDRIY